MKFKRKHGFCIFPIFLLFLIFSLTGCTFSTSIETLLTPPKLTKQQQQIYNALTNSVGNSITLQYPKTGENLSSFIISDLDDDKEDEAIVFYKKNSAAGEDELRINVLDIKNNKWGSVFDAAADGTEVEKIDIRKLGESDTTYISIGYSFVSGTGKSLVIYKYKDLMLNTTFRTPYNYYSVDDYDKDGKNELFVIQNITNTEETSKAVYYEFDSAGLAPHPIERNLSELASDVKNVLFGSLSDGSTSVYIDEIVGSSTIQTEVLHIINNKMEISERDLTLTQRQQEYASVDIDSDGQIEVPVKGELFPGYVETDTDAVYKTVWLKDDGSSFSEKYVGYYNISGGLAFVLPPAWKNNVTCIFDSVKEEYVFARYSNSIEQSTSALLYVAAGKTADEAADLVSDGYTQINEHLGAYSLIYVPQSEDKLIRKTEMIKGNIFFVN